MFLSFVTIFAMEKRAAIKFCFKLGKSRKCTLEMLNGVWWWLFKPKQGIRVIYSVKEWFRRWRTIRENITFSKSREIIHHEIVPPAQTVNAEFSKDILNRLLQRMYRTSSWFVLHDNAPANIFFRYLSHNFSVIQKVGRNNPLFEWTVYNDYVLTISQA